MPRKKDMLRDKLNALKPSIPTKTRIAAAGTKEKTASAAGAKPQKKRPAKKARAEALPSDTMKIQETKPEEPKKPDEVVKGPENEEKKFAFAAFCFPFMIQENLAPLARLRNIMTEEINRLFLHNLGIYCEFLRNACNLFTRSPMVRWPFQF